MKIINKAHHILKDTAGETIAEVLIAFIVLTIMMVLFAQGLGYATNSQANAKESRESADSSMKSLQKQLISTNPTVDGNGFHVEKKNSTTKSAGTSSYTVTPYLFTDANGNKYVVFMPET